MAFSYQFGNFTTAGHVQIAYKFGFYTCSRLLHYRIDQEPEVIRQNARKDELLNLRTPLFDLGKGNRTIYE